MKKNKESSNKDASDTEEEINKIDNTAENKDVVEAVAPETNENEVEEGSVTEKNPSADDDKVTLKVETVTDSLDQHEEDMPEEEKPSEENSTTEADVEDAPPAQSAQD